VSKERRRSPRYELRAPLRLILGDEALPGLLRDICRDAALVESPRELPLETPVTLSLDLPVAGGALQVSGRVVRQSAPEAEVHPLVILFGDLPPAVATHIDLLLAKLEQEG
jgi:hypothetical protein